MKVIRQGKSSGFWMAALSKTDNDKIMMQFKQRKSNDIVSNVSLKDALIRFGITLFLPMLMLLVDKHLIIYTAPVIAYLFFTAIIRFCVVKYVWNRYVRHKPVPVAPPYGQDPNAPEESV